MTLNIVFDVGPNLSANWSKLMATLADFTVKLDAIQATVDAVKQEISDLKAQIAAGGLTADEEAQVLAQLDTLQANLQAAE